MSYKGWSSGASCMTEQVRYRVGDAIEGEIILFQCRKMVWRVSHGSSAHRQTSGRLERRARCVIDKEYTKDA